MENNSLLWKYLICMKYITDMNERRARSNFFYCSIMWIMRNSQIHNLWKKHEKKNNWKMIIYSRGICHWDTLSIEELSEKLVGNFAYFVIGDTEKMPFLTSICLRAEEWAVNGKCAHKKCRVKIPDTWNWSTFASISRYILLNEYKTLSTQECKRSNSKEQGEKRKNFHMN